MVLVLQNILKIDAKQKVSFYSKMSVRYTQVIVVTELILNDT